MKMKFDQYQQSSNKSNNKSSQEHLKWVLSNKCPQDVNICRNVVIDMIEQIMLHYEHIETLDNLAQIEKTQSNMWSQILRNKQLQTRRLYNTIYEALGSSIIRRIEHKGININHVKVHKQFVTNLCGYHASFNLIQSIQCAKYGQSCKIDNAASFWSYLCKTQSFLKEYANRNGFDRAAWPWRDKDLKFGDFERFYWKTCLKNKPLFKTTFQNEEVDGITFTISQNTLFFQYGNLIINEDDKRYMDEGLQKFYSFKPTSKSTMILGCMLGITNHWLALIAQKSINGTDFFLMDSRNRDYLEWTQEEMHNFLITENDNKKKNGMTVWTQFYLDLHLQCIKDIQQCVRLVVELICGYTTIEIFQYNSRMLVFIIPLIQVLAKNDTKLYLQLIIEEHDIPYVYEQVIQWADGYFETVRQYSSHPIVDISNENKQLFCKSMEIIQACQTYTLVQQDLQKQNNLEKIFEKIKAIHRLL